MLAAGQALTVSAGAATLEGPGTPIAEATAAEPTPAGESTSAVESTPVTEATVIAEATLPAEATPTAGTTPAAELPADTIPAALQSRPELATLLAAVQALSLIHI